jgi:hypothetical protein
MNSAADQFLVIGTMAFLFLFTIAWLFLTISSKLNIRKEKAERIKNSFLREANDPELLKFPLLKIELDKPLKQKDKPFIALCFKRIEQSWHLNAPPILGIELSKPKKSINLKFVKLYLKKIATYRPEPSEVVNLLHLGKVDEVEYLANCAKRAKQILENKYK